MPPPAFTFGWLVVYLACHPIFCTLIAMKRFSAFLLPCLALAAHPGQAQTALLNFIGNVQTEAQQVLLGAAVMVIHVHSGKRYSAASNSVGRFVFPTCRPAAS